MLACIACVNKEEGGGGRERDGAGAGSDRDTPTCRDPVKSLTSQVRPSCPVPPYMRFDQLPLPACICARTAVVDRFCLLQQGEPCRDRSMHLAI